MSRSDLWGEPDQSNETVEQGFQRIFGQFKRLPEQPAPQEQSVIEEREGYQGLRGIVIDCRTRTADLIMRGIYSGTGVTTQELLNLDDQAEAAIEAEISKRVVEEKKKRQLQNRSICGCLMCEHHTAPYDDFEAALKQQDLKTKGSES